MAKEIYERKDIEEKYKWDLESMYDGFPSWNLDFEKAMKMAERFQKHRGKLSQSSDNLLQALKDRDKLYILVSNLAGYTHMKLDEDTRISDSQELSDKGMKLIVEANEKTSFLIPEILTIEDSKLKEFFRENQELELYKHHIEDIVRERDHTLSPREELILAQVGEIGNSPSKIYSMLSNADLIFPKVKDKEGNAVEITQGNFVPLLQSKDREYRKEVFEEFYGVFEDFKNTFAASLSGEINKNIFNANIRNFNNSREAALSHNNIPVSVYDNLVKGIHNQFDSIYKYMDLRTKALGIDQHHMYDVYVPMVSEIDLEYTYEECLDIITEALEPLGEEYIEIMKKAFNSRWIDVYENRGKRSGAYSSGSYESKPFILLNFHGQLDDLFTIAHEMGHSMHSYFTRNTQPYVYENYSIFLAEVASMLNEALLLDYMINRTNDKNEKKYLLNHYLDSFRTTMFRQTMFAEFEQKIHETVENGGALTAEYLKKTYKGLNELYYGQNTVIDDGIDMEWARIPHFYMNYYVFQYATGFAAASALSRMILKEEEGAVERYMEFLKSGGSDYPINTLRKAGVDMTTTEPVENCMKIFRELLIEFEKLI